MNTQTFQGTEYPDRRFSRFFPGYYKQTAGTVTLCHKRFVLLSSWFFAVLESSDWELLTAKAVNNYIIDYHIPLLHKRFLINQCELNLYIKLFFPYQTESLNPRQVWEIKMWRGTMWLPLRYV